MEKNKDHIAVKTGTMQNFWDMSLEFTKALDNR